MKKWLAVAFGCVLALSTCFGCGRKSTKIVEDKTKSYIYVASHDAGYGTSYLNALKPLFEERFKDVSFAEGKRGAVLQPVPASCSRETGKDLLAKNDFVVVEDMNLNSYLQISDRLYDMTDWVRTKYTAEDKTDNAATSVTDAEVGTSVEDKLYDDQKSVYTMKEEKYYALPTFAGFTGMTFNADMFKENGFYFADSEEDGVSPIGTNNSAGISYYTGAAYTGRNLLGPQNDAKRSPGPDGIYETSDDGLPSSYEEFFYLLDEIKASGITPVAFSSQSKHYTNYLTQGLLCAVSTPNEMQANFTLDSKGQTIDIITGWNGNEPVVTPTVITEQNGYLVTQMQKKYQALNFMQKLFGEKNLYYANYCNSNLVGNKDNEERFLRQDLNEKISMIIEGNYWYNEASDKRAPLEKNGNMPNVEFMALPAKEKGTVEEGQGTRPALADSFYYGMIASKESFEGSAEKRALGEAFIKFFYQQSSLQAMTIESNIPMAVKYDMTEKQIQDMNSYARSVWGVYKTAKDANAYFASMSRSERYWRNSDKLHFNTTASFFGSAKASNPFDGFQTLGMSTKAYFTGIGMSAGEWK